MTPSLSTSQRHQLDLPTLNATREIVLKELQNQVATWEQNSADAAKRGEYQSAQQYKDWAFAADLCVHTASMAIGALVIDTLESLSVVEDQRTVTLPNLSDSSEVPLTAS
jgi:hypothetical protein